MANIAFEVRVEYTNASNKSNASYVVLATDQSDALRVLIDADVMGSDVSTFHINYAAVESVVYRGPDGGTISRVPGRPNRAQGKFDGPHVRG